MFDAHRRSGRTDAALLAAMSLEQIGAADVDQQVLIGQFRQVTPPRARVSFDEGIARTVARYRDHREAIAAREAARGTQG